MRLSVSGPLPLAAFMFGWLRVGSSENFLHPRIRLKETILLADAAYQVMYAFYKVKSTYTGVETLECND